MELNSLFNFKSHRNMETLQKTIKQNQIAEQGHQEIVIV
jgi:hypothetical protein